MHSLSLADIRQRHLRRFYRATIGRIRPDTAHSIIAKGTRNELTPQIVLIAFAFAVCQLSLKHE
jgi:hypothetical protein